MSDKELLIKELIIKDFNEILVNEFCTDWKEKRLYIELLVRATHFNYLLNYIQQKENIIKEVREYIKQTGQYLEDIKRFKVDVLEPNYLDILKILDKENK